MANNAQATSLYGTVKKIGSSQFTFDYIYKNRREMENAIAGSNTDGVYHGRYVLVSYGDKYGTNSDRANTSVIVTTDEGTDTYTLNVDAGWLANYNIDVQAYQNVYDKTVWQKIFEGPKEKYIMVASLSARAPGLTINKDYYSFELQASANGENYYIKTSSNGTVSNASYIPSYPLPTWHETYSNDLIYHLDMPMPVRMNLQQPYYWDTGFNATLHTERTNSSVDDNYIRWEHLVQSTNNNDIKKVVAADLNFHLPKMGEIISDAYDALYGVPLDANSQPTNGNRPFTQLAVDQNLSLKDATKNALSQTDYQGILYILSQIGLREGPDGHQHYYLSSDWTATSSDFGHIDHKPHKITNITVAANGTWTFSTAVPA